MKTMMRSKVSELHNLYLEGLSLKNISESMNIDLGTVRNFLPTGKLALSFEKVIRARRSFNSLSVILDEAIKHDDALANDNERCVSALEDVGISIKEAEHSLKKMKSHKKSLQKRLSDISAVHKDIKIMLSRDASAVTEAQSTLALAISDKEKQDKINIAEQQEEAQRLHRARLAEKMAEEVIINAATSAAKEMVAKSIGKRLEREAQ